MLFRSYANEISYLKTWVSNRIAWMDINMPGNCYTVGENEEISQNFFNVYPNPANEYLNISFNSAAFKLQQITLYDGLGNTVYQTTSNKNNLQLDLSSYQIGRASCRERV